MSKVALSQKLNNNLAPIVLPTVNNVSDQPRLQKHIPLYKEFPKAMENSGTNVENKPVNVFPWLPILIKSIIITFLVISFGCNTKKVSDSRIYELHYVEATEHEIKSFEHYIFVGNDYYLQDVSDSLYLIAKSKKYVDTVKYNKPISGIIYINNEKYFPKMADYQNWSEIRKVSFLKLFFGKTA
jgi:hypothetical protein